MVNSRSGPSSADPTAQVGLTRGQTTTATGGTPEHGGAVANRGYRGNGDVRMLTRRAQGHGEADAEDRRSRRVGVLPESVAEDDAAARARRREAEQHLQGTRASELGVRRRSATRGSEPSKQGKQWLTGGQEFDGRRRR